MNDTISRKAAIDLAHELIIHDLAEYRECNQVINNYCAEIMTLPSTQPQKIRGYWIRHFDWDSPYGFECSKCGIGMNVNYRFCPNCGADMREGEG